MNEQAQMTYNKLDLLKLMYLSREGDRREGVLHRQSKGWFQVAGMGHEALAVVPMLTKFQVSSGAPQTPSWLPFPGSAPNVIFKPRPVLG